MLNYLRNKKGDINFITGMILVLGGFVIITIVIMGFSSNASDREAETLCKTSIDMRARTQINVEGVFSNSEIKPIPSMCKTIDRKVYGSRDQIMEQISYSMVRCWWMFGEGRYEEILKDSDVSVFPKLFDERWKNDCFNCYTILVDEDQIEGGSITSQELADYIYSHKHPDLSNVTYLEYIQYYGGPGRLALLTPDISPRNSYSISFAPINKKDTNAWVGFFKAGFGFTLGVVVPGVGFVGYSGVNDIRKAYSERDVSTIILNDLRTAQEECGSGDIAGK